MADTSMILVTEGALSLERAVRAAATSGSGCVVTYVGLIRDTSMGKAVSSVTYSDPDGTAAARLQAIADEIRREFPIENIAIHHRIGELAVGDENLVIAVATPHRGEGFRAVALAVDLFKEALPTAKLETYTDGSTFSAGRPAWCR